MLVLQDYPGFARWAQSRAEGDLRRFMHEQLLFGCCCARAFPDYNYFTLSRFVVWIEAHFYEGVVDDCGYCDRLGGNGGRTGKGRLEGVIDEASVDAFVGVGLVLWEGAGCIRGVDGS